MFGGICLYKSPQEALDLALKREMQDLRDDNYSEDAMREFFRDMIANLNGMYHVMTVNPDLLAQNKMNRTTLSNDGTASEAAKDAAPHKKDKKWDRFIFLYLNNLWHFCQS